MGERRGPPIINDPPAHYVLAVCPFCGPNCSSPELIQMETVPRWQVVHGPCGAASGHHHDPEVVIHAWNMRDRFGPVAHVGPIVFEKGKKR